MPARKRPRSPRSHQPLADQPARITAAEPEEVALAYAEALELAGHTDWRLPNAKELQSIVDYTRAPDASDPAYRSAAIDPLFEIGSEDSFFWTGTTHARSDGTGPSAVYICFGRALGYTMGSWMDVHGAGAQRSDEKAWDGGDYTTGDGPQNDAVRIYHYVRPVRDGA